MLLHIHCNILLNDLIHVIDVLGPNSVRSQTSMLHLKEFHGHLLEHISLFPLLPDTLELKVLKEAALDLLYIL